MQALNVPNGSTPTLVVDAGNRDFLHLQNNSAVDMFICYDSDKATAVANLTVNNGIKIAAGGTYMLNNDGIKQIFTKPVYVVHASGSAQTLIVQGA